MIEKIKKGLISLDIDAQQYSIHLIGYIFEKFRGYEDSSAPEEISCIKIDEPVICELKETLINYLNSSPNDVNRSSAYNALGKLFDDKMKEFFTKALKKEIEVNPSVSYQVMIALNNLGEDCFDGKESLSMFDFEENIESAIKYLGAQ